MDEHRQGLPDGRPVSWMAFTVRSRLGRYSSYSWKRLLRVRATPHEIALGVAAGVFAACTPFLGIQMLMAAGLALALRANIAAALMATFVGNPLSWPAIWGTSYVAGALALGLDPAFAADQIADGAAAIGETLKDPTAAKLDAAVDNLFPLVEPIVIGSLIVGLLAAVACYYPTHRAVRLFQNRRAAL
jgi:uncharacterized protein